MNAAQTRKTSVWDRMRPELRAVLEAMAADIPSDLKHRSVPDQRAWGASRSEIFTGPARDDGVAWRAMEVPGAAGAPPVPVRVYEPADREPVAPAVVYLHGGGMWAGGIVSEHPLASSFSATVAAVTVTVEYRLAPESPYPAAVDDCLAVLRWVAANAEGLGVDPGRIAMYGASAGGGLALATALRARDEGGPRACFVMAVQPMIDDRHETASSLEFRGLGPAFYDREANQVSWSRYLGGRPADAYAAPARALDLADLPATFIDVGDLDLFRDEDVSFAQRLAAAGVPTELHVYPGAVHSFENLAPELDVSRLAKEIRRQAFRRAFDR